MVSCIKSRVLRTEYRAHLSNYTRRSMKELDDRKAERRHSDCRASISASHTMCCATSATCRRFTPEGTLTLIT